MAQSCDITLDDVRKNPKRVWDTSRETQDWRIRRIENGLQRLCSDAKSPLDHGNLAIRCRRPSQHLLLLSDAVLFANTLPQFCVR